MFYEHLHIALVTETAERNQCTRRKDWAALGPTPSLTYQGNEANDRIGGANAICHILLDFWRGFKLVPPEPEIWL